MRKAQLLTIDFVLSLAIFVSILLTLVTVWSSIDAQVRDVESRRELQTLSLSVSDLLVRNPGNPIDWNSTNVKSIGLATEERVLSLNKITAIMGMGYDDVKSRLRLGGLSMLQSDGTAYDFDVVFVDSDGYNLTSGVVRSPIAYYARDRNRARILEKIEGSGLVWDLYWGNAEAQIPGGSFGAYSPRHRYNILGLAQQVDFFNQYLVMNQSSYRTIIIENLDPSDPGIGLTNDYLNITGLQEFLSNGGILVVVGQGAEGANVIDENFSVHGAYQAGGWGDGEVADPWHMLPKDSLGRGVSFGSSRWYLYSDPGDAEIKTIVSQEGEPSRCMICRWNYGFGRIYYIEDLEGSLEGGAPLQDSVAVIGEQLKFGLSPAFQSQVVIVRRTAILEGPEREPVGMTLRVWK